MKSLKTILAAALVIGAAVPAMAQFSNSGGGVGNSASADTPESYNILSIGYDCTSINPDHGDSESTNGVALQYTNGMKVSADHPLYFEWGIRAALGFWSESYDDDEEEKLTTLNLTVPLSIAYRIPIGQTASVTPYTGLHAKGNILASYKIEYDGDSETLNMFDKDDVGKDDQWKRFQFGWQIGARVSFSSFHVGFEYGLDFNEICKKCKTSNIMVSVGVNI